MATRTIPGAGLLKGFGVTIKTMLSKPVTQQYPHERPTLAPRTRGVIALMDENCTVCMLCARECPDWCIYIDSHKETVPPAKEGGRARTRNVLDRFAIDFALCMYCGICVEVCPFDALWWSPEFEYAEYSIDGLLHEKERLREWADTVLPPPELDEGAVRPAEVVSALEAHAAEIAAAEQAALEAEQQAEAKADAPDVPDKVEVPERPTIADIELEGETQVDQEVFDELVAEGKSERMARAKAKAAWVKAEKRKQLDDAVAAWEQEKADAEEHNRRVDEMLAEATAGGGGSAPVDVGPKPTLADMEIEGETQIDQATFDELVEAGKSERMARAKAKAAWVKSQKAELLEAAVAEWEERRAEADAAASSGGNAPVAGTAAPSRDVPPRPTLADVEVEGEVQVDQEVFDQLVADGKSERMARSKAKASWVKARKQEILDEQLAVWEREHGGEQQADQDAADAAAADAGGGQPTLGNVRFEGEVEIDQDVYDQLIADGKSERIARSKAKAAYVKAQKQRQLDEGQGDDA